MNKLSFYLMLIIFHQGQGEDSCPPGFVTDTSVPNSVCNPVKQFKQPGESCEVSMECDQSRNFECIKSKCQCNSETSILQAEDIESTESTYSISNGGICVGKVGSPCSEKKFCMKDAICNVTAGNICSCSDPFKPTSERLCGRPPMWRCSETEICQDGFVCLPTYSFFPYLPGSISSFTSSSSTSRDSFHQSYPSTNNRNIRSLPNLPVTATSASVRGNRGRVAVIGIGSYFPGQNIYGGNQMGSCQCIPKYQIYDYVNQTCRSLVGAPCDINSPSSCVDKGHCIRKENMGQLAQCECQEGFVETMDGKCDIAFGEPCEYLDVHILPGKVMQCDQAGSLICKKGKCSCESDEDIFDPQRRQCVTKTGLRCQMDQNCETGFCLKKNDKLWGRCGPKTSQD